MHYYTYMIIILNDYKHISESKYDIYILKSQQFRFICLKYTPHEISQILGIANYNF